MAIKKILGKLFSSNTMSVEEGENIRRRKLTPDEVELMSFKERERRDNIKKELAMYRRKNDNELLVGNRNMLKSKNILNQKNVFK